LASFTFRFMLDANRMFLDDNTAEKIRPYLRFLNSIAIRTKKIFVLYFVIIVRDLKLKLMTDEPNDFSVKKKKQTS
jgi:hypothetical protein